MKTVQERFNAKVLVTPGCWLWNATRDGGGYGRMKVGGSFVRTHRLSYELHVGAIPHGMCVCHRCDVPACVNPEHLFVGTQLDNIKDRCEKGRTAKHGKAHGIGHYKAKLTAADAFAIRDDARTQDAIAAAYGIAQAQVWRIKHGRHWAFR